MSPPEKTPKLRLAPPETPEELARRFERETRPALLQRESRLENSLGQFKVGSVPYLNAVPLTRGLEEQILFRAALGTGPAVGAGRIGRRAGQYHGSFAEGSL